MAVQDRNSRGLAGPPGGTSTTRRGPAGTCDRGNLVTQDEFAGMFRTFRESAFHLETRGFYAMTYERDAFQRFLDGQPVPPSGLPWWQAWLDQMQELAPQGKRIGRVRVLSEPPSDYQRWELWGTSWHIEAGEEIRYMSRRADRRARSKISKIENGRQMPSAEDIRTWAAECGHPAAADDLLDMLADVQAVHRRWRTRLRRGHAAVQEDLDRRTGEAKRIRSAQVLIMPGPHSDGRVRGAS